MHLLLRAVKKLSDKAGNGNKGTAGTTQRFKGCGGSIKFLLFAIKGRQPRERPLIRENHGSPERLAWRTAPQGEAQTSALSPGTV